jgi:hypothetical protein
MAPVTVTYFLAKSMRPILSVHHRYWQEQQRHDANIQLARALGVDAFGCRHIDLARGFAGVAAGRLDAGWRELRQIFEKSGNRIQFKDRHAGTTLGMIVSGNKIVGPNGSCVAHRVVPKGDHLSIGLRCSDAVIFADLSLSLKFVDSTHFVRADPLFPENTYGYHKCAM